MDSHIYVPAVGGGLKVDNSQFTRNGETIYRQRVDAYNAAPINVDVGGRTRVSQLTTLFDGKTLTADEPLLWDTKGTGSDTFSRNKSIMTVTAGQYHIRQGRFYTPYFSGKPHVIDATFDKFALQAGVIKRVGYFSSNAVAPYASSYDGVWIESNGDDGTYYLCVYNNGTEKLKLPWTQWQGYSELAGYDWDKFTVILIDFLWLGGAALRLFVKNPAGGFTLAHTFDYAGTAAGEFMDNPQLPVRYEIRSTTGAGAISAICSQVATEGSFSERGKSLTVYNGTALACNVVGTIYALKGVRKTAAYRNTSTRAESFGGVIVSATSDAGILLLFLNPTLSAPLTWAANSRVEEGTATNQTITPGTGRLLASVQMVDAGVAKALEHSMLSELPIGIDNAVGEIILGYMPLTANQNVSGIVSLLEY